MSQTPAQPTIDEAPIRAGIPDFARRVAGFLAALVATSLVVASVFAFVGLNRAPLPEETILLAASDLAGSWSGPAAQKSSP